MRKKTTKMKNKKKVDKDFNSGEDIDESVKMPAPIAKNSKEI